MYRLNQWSTVELWFQLAVERSHFGSRRDLKQYSKLVVIGNTMILWMHRWSFLPLIFQRVPQWWWQKSFPQNALGQKNFAKHGQGRIALNFYKPFVDLLNGKVSFVIGFGACDRQSKVGKRSSVCVRIFCTVKTAMYYKLILEFYQIS
jgi:hypothetical protein